MKTRISNAVLAAEIRHRGAELSSLYSAHNKLEYIWNADPAFWGKSSPVLFPIVGQLRNNQYTFQGTAYTLPRHGFAREMDFERIMVRDNEATFRLNSDAETLKRYPFPFELRVTYTLQEDTLAVTYTVANPSADAMLFSLGAHPAFNVPLVRGTDYADHYLLFGKAENASRWNISNEGLIDASSRSLLRNDTRLKLTKELFHDDALVFRDLASDQIALLSSSHPHGIHFSFPGFPYFGIWAARDADFVCLEPWCGIADSVTHLGTFENKEGIVRLQGGAEWCRSWTVRCF